ncbi:unnamed protein product [Arabidopsis thaliana]|uniref:Uncharacterized protein n=1 Tax=Arabidopsis thaliana TaxID=3702 RepID=A0A654FJH1_ARATH|nr:unnamed protein product [Arabidopsis thaliana]
MLRDINVYLKQVQPVIGPSSIKPVSFGIVFLENPDELGNDIPIYRSPRVSFLKKPTSPRSELPSTSPRSEIRLYPTSRTQAQFPSDLERLRRLRISCHVKRGECRLTRRDTISARPSHKARHLVRLTKLVSSSFSSSSPFSSSSS